MEDEYELIQERRQALERRAHFAEAPGILRNMPLEQAEQHVTELLQRGEQRFREHTQRP